MVSVKSQNQCGIVHVIVIFRCLFKLGPLCWLSRGYGCIVFCNDLMDFHKLFSVYANRPELHVHCALQCKHGFVLIRTGTTKET